MVIFNINLNISPKEIGKFFKKNKLVAVLSILNIGLWGLVILNLFYLNNHSLAAIEPASGKDEFVAFESTDTGKLNVYGGNVDAEQIGKASGNSEMNIYGINQQSKK